MNELSEIEIEDIGMVYILANTPRYLYRHLRALPPVQRMGERLSAEEIRDLYSHNQKKKNKSIEDVSLAYAALVALAFKDRPQFLESLDIRGLEWAPEILDILIKTEWTSKIITLEMPAHKRSYYDNLPSNVMETTKEVKNEPLIRVVRN